MAFASAREDISPFQAIRKLPAAAVSWYSQAGSYPGIVEMWTMNNGERLIEPENDDLAPEAAQYILRLDFPRKDHQRMQRLSAKAAEGTLTEKERAELHEYLQVADLLALLQSKVRRALQRTGT